MTPERWQQIERLYHSAREHGTAVLAETDPELRREVERLLTQDSDGKILDRRAQDFLADSDTAQLTTVPAAEWEGRTISHYRVLEKLGAGGMGVVYKAFDTRLGRAVALKFLPPHMRHDRELKQHLTDEARAASALDHPNIVVVHDIGETAEGDLFIAMALHEGSTLRERMKSPLPVLEALRIARQVASGLAKAHEKSIFHRDIKPANIIVAQDGVARIIDFGLAKSSDATATVDGSARGTPLYMSPEQAAGKPVDHRTDLWSLGAVLYEMLAGKPPFGGDSQLQVMHAIVHDPPPRLRRVRPDLPEAIGAIVARAMEKDLAQRYQSAAEMSKDLSAAIEALAVPVRQRSHARTAGALAAVLLVAAAATWLYRRSEQRHWAREEAIPRIATLAAKQPVAAFLLLLQVERILPRDPRVESLARSIAVIGSIETEPAGAKVEIQDYTSPSEPWLPLGTTPIAKVTRPAGHFRWKVTVPGAQPFIAAPETDADVKLSLPGPRQPAGMVPIPAGEAGDMIDFIGWQEFTLPAFDVDKFEVTNARYQEFVDKSGYRTPQYWKEKFVRDGKTLTWDQAMELLHDSTGRPGPSTWEAGHFPSGRGDYPVSGVSWYEAAAYAEFSGKSLPAVMQWYKAAPPDLAPDTIGQSNFNGLGPVRVGSSGGVGPYGTYDMAGNVREWCLNSVDGDSRFILGGAWRTQTYQAYDPEALPPFDRSEFNGIRCVRNHGPLPAAAVGPVVRKVRDFSRAKPVSDEVFKAYRMVYAYDPAGPDPRNETVVASTADWTEEKLTIDAGYGRERLPVHLFLPKNVRPPYQAVVFFPSARVNDSPSSDELGDMQFVDYVIQSGRALIYPIYSGTYERRGDRENPGSIGDLQRVIRDAKEVRRSVDYLQSRGDIDKSKIAYLGVSQGTAEGVIFAALEDRFKAVVFLDGGFFLTIAPMPAKDQVNFVTRLTAPVLMVNGRYDFTFSPERAQLPLYRMLGTPPADKRYVVFDTPHDISQKKADLSKEVLAWLDKYLGRLN